MFPGSWHSKLEHLVFQGRLSRKNVWWGVASFHPLSPPSSLSLSLSLVFEQLCQVFNLFSLSFFVSFPGSLSSSHCRSMPKLDMPAFDWPFAPFPRLRYPIAEHKEFNDAEEQRCLQRVSRNDHSLKILSLNQSLIIYTHGVAQIVLYSACPVQWHSLSFSTGVKTINCWQTTKQGSVQQSGPSQTFFSIFNEAFCKFSGAFCQSL